MVSFNVLFILMYLLYILINVQMLTITAVINQLCHLTNNLQSAMNPAFLPGQIYKE